MPFEHPPEAQKQPRKLSRQLDSCTSKATLIMGQALAQDPDKLPAITQQRYLDVPDANARCDRVPYKTPLRKSSPQQPTISTCRGYRAISRLTKTLLGGKQWFRFPDQRKCQLLCHWRLLFVVA